jgi:hypothetical protein
MTSTSKRSPSSQVIGPSYMIVDSKILKVNCLLDGWGPMWLIQFMTMVQ